MGILFIVSDKFKRCRINTNVITIKELQDCIVQNRQKLYPKNTKLLVGQGISEIEIQQILDMLKTSSMKDSFDISLIQKRPMKAGRIHTHKNLLKNSIVSIPKQLSENLFEIRLMIDERCELMSDHQTGQHIQGMIIIEAARQTFLAVTEEFFIGPYDHNPYYFVINSMAVSFQSFLFPIDTIIFYEITDKDSANRKRMKFTVEISFIQNSQTAAKVLTEFTTFHREKIEQKEKHLVEQVLSQRKHLLDTTNTHVSIPLV